MTALNIICFGYMVVLIMGLVVNYDKCSDNSVKVRTIDNISLIVCMIIFYFINRS